MDQALLDGGYRCYTGEKIDVYFNTAICQHSGNCVRGNGKLFNLKRKPWIMPDEVDVATVVKVIDTCPSGAGYRRVTLPRHLPPVTTSGLASTVSHRPATYGNSAILVRHR